MNSKHLFFKVKEGKCIKHPKKIITKMNDNKYDKDMYTALSNIFFCLINLRICLKIINPKITINVINPLREPEKKISKENIEIIKSISIIFETDRTLSSL
jgi:hypothetical protein